MMPVALRYVIGCPDGWLIRLRCWVLGHRWETCADKCCEGELHWCLRCAAYEALSEGGKLAVGASDAADEDVRDVRRQEPPSLSARLSAANEPAATQGER